MLGTMSDEEVVEAAEPLTEAELVEIMAATAQYLGIDLGNYAPEKAYRAGARLANLKGYQARGSKDNPVDYGEAQHLDVLVSLAQFARANQLDVPDDARCGTPRPAANGSLCLRLRIPGYDHCHWHPTSRSNAREKMAIMRAAIGMGD